MAAELFADDAVSAAVAQLVGELGTGARLPSERELAAKLKVSRNALRDRLSLLEALGVLERRSGSGTYVQQLQPRSLTLALNIGISASHLPIEALGSVRVALERQAAKEAARVAEPVPIAYMRKAIKTMAESDEADVVLQADLLFHQSLLRAAENPALLFFADALTGVFARDLTARGHKIESVLSGGTEKMVDVHMDVYESVLSGDEQAAMAAVDRHFDAFDMDREYARKD